MKQCRVLFVDDDVLNQWLLTETLVTAGFTVTGLCRGGEAVEQLIEGQEYDLLLTDFHLPDGMSGFELAAHWRALLPGRPVIYTSTFPQMAIGPLQDDEGFIPKNAEAPDLLRLVALLLDEAGYFRPPMAPRRALSIH